MFSFLSIEFALSFLLFFIVYWLFRTQPKIQNYILILTSYSIIYLMAGWMPIIILLAFTGIVFLISQGMEKYAQHRKKWMLLGVIVALMQLSLFKFYDFFKPAISQSLNQLQLDSSGLAAHLILPLGISYYTFQGISYLVSRYRQAIDVPQLSLAALLMHFSFFATITAGPIARVGQAKGLTDIENQPCAMAAQINTTRPRQILLPTLAFALLALALIKKWWIAGWLAEHWVNPIFANPMQYHSLEVLVAIYAYTLQLFLDFSGYSEMMIAFGLLLGFRLPVNFRAPLLAHNIRVFWDRWHISLSTWIRDHIYIPLGGSRDGFTRTQFNLLSAMVLSGVWHGSGWNFFLWGLLHGLALVLLNISDRVYAKTCHLTERQARDGLANSGWFGKACGVFVTVSFVSLCFVFFRAKTLDEALQVFEALLNNYINVTWTQNPLYVLYLMILAWVAYPLVRGLVRYKAIDWRQLPKYSLSLPLFILFMLIILCAPSGIPGFIYANF